MNLTEAQKAIETILAEVYKSGYDEGRCKGYQNRRIEEEFENTNKYECGLNDAWVCAKKLRHMDYSTLYKVFEGDDVVIHNIQMMGLEAVFEKYSASEAIAKVKEYEEKQKQADDEIKVGDELTTNDVNNNFCVVVADLINGADYHIMRLLYSDGSSGEWEYQKVYTEFKKTGRHFPQITEVLKQMQEERE